MRRIFTIFTMALLVCAFSLAQVNYTFTSGTTAYTALSGASSFTWTTTIANDDEYSSAVNIFAGGENFNYCGTTFTQFQASTNGFIRLGTGLSSAITTDALSSTIRSIIAPLWQDLAVSATATDVTYLISGSTPNQVLTVEWKNVKWSKTATVANAEFQVKLYESDGHIEFVYGNLEPPTVGSASIGLVNNTAISTANSATGTYLSINVGGTAGSRVYHQSMGYTFNGIAEAPDDNTILTFTKVTPSEISAGTYTVGGTTPTYSTLSEAAMALNINGISGAIVLDVRAGTYDGIFHLIDVAGTSSSNTITLKKESGTVTLSPSNGSQSTSAPGSAAGDAIIRLDGTDYVTVDGLTLTQNAGNTTAAKKFNMGVSLNNSVLNTVPQSGAQNNTFKNMSIDLGVTGGLTAGLIGIRLGTTGTTTGAFSQTNSFNTIQDITITGFHAAAIKMFGHSVSNPDSVNKITAVSGRNTIGSVTGGIGSDIRTIELDCQSTITIEKTDISSISNTINTTNHIYGIASNLAGLGTQLNRGVFTICNNTISGLSNGGSGVTSGFAYGIGFGASNVSTVYEIYNNKIYNLYSNGSTSSRAIGVQINGATTTNLVAKVYNNMVSDIRAPRSTSAPGVRGLDMQNSGGTGTLSVCHNTVNLNDSEPPTSSAHNSACLYFASMATSSLDVRNNIFINTMSSSTGKATVLMPSANSNYLRMASTSDYNLYYSGASPSATQGISWDFTTLRQTLADHQAAVASGGLGGPRDVNAKSAAVTFANALSDLHVAGGSIGDWQNLTGTLLASPYDVDIDGNTRNNPPYMGADENLGTPLPVELTSFSAIANGNRVELQWNTATEINNYGFEIERSEKGNAGWAKVGFVAGAGNSNAPRSYSFVDANVQGAVSYRLKQIDRDGQFTYSSVVEVVIAPVAEKYELAQNFPNPFNPTTTIRFAVKTTEHASVKVYDITGREVATLFNDVAQVGHVYNVQFNATGLASGIYFYVLQTPNVREVKKMQMLK